MTAIANVTALPGRKHEEGVEARTIGPCPVDACYLSQSARHGASSCANPSDNRGTARGVGVLVCRKPRIGRAARTGSQATWAALCSQDHRLGVRTLLAVISIVACTLSDSCFSASERSSTSACVVALNASTSNNFPYSGLAHVRCVALGAAESGRVRTLLTFRLLSPPQTVFSGVRAFATGVP